MPSVKNKADYVRKQKQFRKHHCHWPGCEKEVPPAMWGCREHWFTLPKRLRDMIWRYYRPGQEKDKRPSKQYLQAATFVQNWITNYLKETKNVSSKQRSTKRNSKH
jgi:hypothetical protein